MEARRAETAQAMRAMGPTPSRDRTPAAQPSARGSARRRSGRESADRQRILRAMETPSAAVERSGADAPGASAREKIAPSAGRAGAPGASVEGETQASGQSLRVPEVRGSAQPRSSSAASNQPTPFRTPRRAAVGSPRSPKTGSPGHSVMRTLSARSQIYHLPKGETTTSHLSELSVREDVPVAARELAKHLAQFKHGNAAINAAIEELVRRRSRLKCTGNVLLTA